MSVDLPYSSNLRHHKRGYNLSPPHKIAWSEGYLRHYATLDIPTRVIQDDAQGFIELRRNPLGVVAGIVAWNFPVLVACWKIGPATLAGNTIVLKPAPTNPATTLALASLAKRIMENSASSLKSLTLELGGNDPAIALDDIVVKMTAQNIFTNAFLTAGQVCLAVKRAYVSRVNLRRNVQRTN